ncbi:5-oxoprolinase subunit PxpA [Oceaniradius stylonematis]|uniref:5-oxoprolinase subunit PxpA n=1 Tax=Oceaniradius stylonematis TaxID=2184161 RepID=A0A3A8AKU5_9HYPH|nr:5-oxoprolinase subunit PxpA [Oceaniradius stylonematis]RKF06493.1 5-oxoprolinase subunit PxpA [Oceaniradius stylonematis]
MSVDINCDMGESFGLYKMGDDEGIMPFITQANVACGFHGSDPNHMRSTVELAKRHDVRVGAHVSLPDLPGFGRREMKIERGEMANIIIYQIGALNGFLRVAGMGLSHIKPHGALYGMAARERHIADAVADAAQAFGVPILGLAGTLHEEVFGERGLEFQAEFFADLDYADDGRLIITREHEAVEPSVAAERAINAVRDGVNVTVGGKRLPVRAETICVHSDTPNAVAIAKAVRDALSTLKAA